MALFGFFGVRIVVMRSSRAAALATVVFELVVVKRRRVYRFLSAGLVEAIWEAPPQAF